MIDILCMLDFSLRLFLLIFVFGKALVRHGKPTYTVKAHTTNTSAVMSLLVHTAGRSCRFVAISS